MTEQSPEIPQDDAEDAEAVPARREPIFNLPPVVVAFMVICVGAHAVSTYLLDDRQYFWLLEHAAFIPVLYSGRFTLDFYPIAGPVTYSLLHGSWTHLVINMVWLGAFGSPLANRIGAARFVLFWFAASIAAAALHYVLYMTDQSPLIGASGAVSGMMGAAARFAFRIDRSSGHSAFGGPVLPVSTVLRSRGVVTFLGIWMLVNLVTGVLGYGGPGIHSQIAWEAHIGGFLVGFFWISSFDRTERTSQA